MGIKWTEEEKRIVAEMYPTHFAREIAEKLGKTTSGVYNMANALGLKASREKLAKGGRMTAKHPNSIATRFKKGGQSPNKGKKMPEHVYEKLKDTMFKKGDMPSNYKPIGSERITKDGYVEVKVGDPSEWRPKHRILWEKENGPIPEGYNVQFKDGNRQNIKLENLYLISRAEQVRKENSVYARYPQELRHVIALKGAIKRKVNEYNKKQREDNGKES